MLDSAAPLHASEDWLTGADGRQIFFRSIRPDGDARAILLVIHGLSEHSGRFVHVMEHFARRGFATYAPDHRGHGRSARTLGDLESMDAVVGDIGVLHRKALAAHPGVPVCVLGHSMGGLISVLYAQRAAHELAALITSGVAMDIPDDVPDWLIKVSGLLGKLVPRLGVQPFYEPQKLSRDAAVLAEVERDPLFYKGRLRARTGAQILQGIETAIAGLQKMDLPLLVTHGSADETVPPRASEILFGGAASEDKTLHLFDGLFHEVHNEPEREAVLSFWSDWLTERVP
jgi:alpha-beta hydrolase superfamily lysophospholipase